MQYKLNEQQLNAIRAMFKRKSPAPACGGFLFINQSVVLKYSDLCYLIKNGLMFKLNNENELYDLTSAGKNFAGRITK